MAHEDKSLLIALEVIRGQIDNTHHTLEEQFLKSVLNPSVAIPKESRKGKQPQWKAKESRVIYVPITVTCIDPVAHIFCVEEFTWLQSISKALSDSVDRLLEQARSVSVEAVVEE